MNDREELDLSGNKNWYSTIASLSGARLQKVKVLNLSRCDIRELPAELSALCDLENLDLSWNEHLTFFPASACVGLKKLKVLNLNHCDIWELPAELSAMSELEKLDLSWNRYVNLFPASACIGLKKLKVLNLSHCDIQELPAELSAVSLLENLDVSWNFNLRLLPAPAFVGLKKLTVLNLSHCDIQEVPAELSALSDLQSLDLCLNESLQFFPASTCVGLKSLKVLNLCDCDILGLPAELTAMRNLEKLDLSCNENLHLFPTSYVGLKKLKVLNWKYCRYNMLELARELSEMDSPSLSHVMGSDIEEFSKYVLPAKRTGLGENLSQSHEILSAYKMGVELKGLSAIKTELPPETLTTQSTMIYSDSVGSNEVPVGCVSPSILDVSLEHKKS